MPAGSRAPRDETLRLPSGVSRRAGALRRFALDAIELATAPTATRAHVLRLAALRGLQLLELEYANAQEDDEAPDVGCQVVARICGEWLTRLAAGGLGETIRIRLPFGVVRRCEALARSASADQSAERPPIAWTDVVRVAVVRGLEWLELDHDRRVDDELAREAELRLIDRDDPKRVSWDIAKAEGRK